jgi:hypothetical protein
VYIFPWFNIMMFLCIKVRWLGCGEACRKTNRQAIRLNTNDGIGAVAYDFAHKAADEGRY